LNLPDVIWLNLLLFVAGVIVIIRGSDLFLDNAVWIARAAGVSQMIIGATVVSLCTTLPEMVASVTAALKGTADMAVGNAVGSVICNTGLILGVTLLFVTARVQREVFLIKGVFMVGSMVMALLLLAPGPESRDFMLTPEEGGVLLTLLVVFLVVNYYESLHGAEPVQPEKVSALEAVESGPGISTGPRDWAVHLGSFAVGAVLLTGGAYLLIEYGQRLARNLNISEAIISLIFISVGTSLPELFTAISAIRKNATNISVGNVFGANVLNIAMVTGSAAVVRPLHVHDRLLLRLDMPVAVVLGTVAFGSGLFRGRIARKTGWTLLTIYVGYLVTAALRMRGLIH